MRWNYEDFDWVYYEDYLSQYESEFVGLPTVDPNLELTPVGTRQNDPNWDIADKQAARKPNNCWKQHRLTRYRAS